MVVEEEQDETAVEEEPEQEQAVEEEELTEEELTEPKPTEEEQDCTAVEGHIDIQAPKELKPMAVDEDIYFEQEA